jgi:hypothetical protein
MSREEQPILNLSNKLHKKLLVERIKTLEGLHRVDIARLRDQKTLSQVAYIWGVCYPVLAQGLTEAWGGTYDSVRTHAVMKKEFLCKPIVNMNTGEVVAGEIRSLGALDIDECSQYIDALISFGETVGVSIPPPAHYEEASKC